MDSLDLSIDDKHIWHPYSAMFSDFHPYPVVSAENVYLHLDNGKKIIDGMSSWWCVIHGYNHPVLNAALKSQIDEMSHVMFGGLTHPAVINLTKQLLNILPKTLSQIFYCDSGSVAVEVAMKMAIQYWHGKGQAHKQRFISLSGGYHGDTLGAMSVCDPVTGMHSLFNQVLPQQIFIPRPNNRFNENCNGEDLTALENALKNNNDIAAFILEPIVQGAGGMWFYSADYLQQAKSLCEKYNALLIADEIATGFGRTGKLFACEHANISPDIMCIGKALTAGYMSLAATVTSKEIAMTIDAGEPGVFMHGPTFMANPLACSVATASINLLLSSDWQNKVKRIETHFNNHLEKCNKLECVNEVRVLGAIGVVELHQPVNMKSITRAFVDNGVWVRPFGKLVYLMPPFIISDEQLLELTDAVYAVLARQVNE